MFCNCQWLSCCPWCSFTPVSPDNPFIAVENYLNFTWASWEWTPEWLPSGQSIQPLTDCDSWSFCQQLLYRNEWNNSASESWSFCQQLLCRKFVRLCPNFDYFQSIWSRLYFIPERKEIEVTHTLKRIRPDFQVYIEIFMSFNLPLRNLCAKIFQSSNFDYNLWFWDDSLDESTPELWNSKISEFLLHDGHFQLFFQLLIWFV